MITITDDNGEVVYMRFIDVQHMDAYAEILSRMNADSVEVKTAEGESFFNMPDYVQNLLRRGKR